MNQPVCRSEFEARMGDIKGDLNACGNSMRSQIKDLKNENKDEFIRVWKTFDMMLVKTGVVVTICCSIVMAVFKMIEAKG